MAAVFVSGMGEVGWDSGRRCCCLGQNAKVQLFSGKNTRLPHLPAKVQLIFNYIPFRSRKRRNNCTFAGWTSRLVEAGEIAALLQDREAGQRIWWGTALRLQRRGDSLDTGVL
ncbi:hypothetical protein D3C75_844510 [compost metagenome]